MSFVTVSFPLPASSPFRAPVFPPWALFLHGRSDYSRPPDGQKPTRISGAGGTARKVGQSGLRVSTTSANVHY